MNTTVWKVLSAIELVAMIALTAWAVVSGGCTTQVELASGMSTPMKCFWCFRAVTFVGIIGVAASAIALFAKTTGARRSGAALSALAATMAMLLPSSMGIGLCTDATMHCHTTALGVWVIGAVAIVIAIVQIAKAEPQPTRRR